jgi:hypothetical protein
VKTTLPASDGDSADLINADFSAPSVTTVGSPSATPSRRNGTATVSSSSSEE